MYLKNSLQGKCKDVCIKEHLASKSGGSLISPLGKHSINAHCGNDIIVKCTILTWEAEISARKALEAFCSTVENSEMNNKNECLSKSSGFFSVCNVMRAIDCR
ncbi:hypothetical protein Y032_0109g124 [Ancylostoma ceylanicum]|uniref:Uncharacterized protein n=1 Tax=Ancylostoma ceylanicum TaxID=53326 RepID=A0A016TES9_9BILA|nr:hypothetical protein Y032_0109g124 [Ancylostoma ceylanicum]